MRPHASQPSSNITLTPFTADEGPFIGVVRLFHEVWPTRGTENELAVRIRDHAALTNFRGVAATQSVEPVTLLTTLTPVRVVGFAYGHANLPGQWWHDQVARWLDPHALPTFSQCFTVTELAVAPTHRRRGVAQRLHDALLHRLPHQYAVLSTARSNQAALNLYRKLGWRVLLPSIMFEGVREPFTVLWRTTANS